MMKRDIVSEQQLSTYRISANALQDYKPLITGISVASGCLLSTEPAAEAAVVYSSPLDITMSTGNKTSTLNMAAGDRMVLRWWSFLGAPRGLIIPSANAELVGVAAYASNLNLNSGISAGNNWYDSAAMLFYGNQPKNQFGSATPGYVGFRFNPGAGERYGWLHVDSVAVDKSSYHVNGWAYEDSGSPINAGDGAPTGSAIPEPTSLAMLACGAAGVLALRRKRCGNKAK